MTSPKHIVGAAALFFTAACGGGEEADTGDAAAETAAFQYPETVTVEQIDTYHGRDVADPYRWLEDDVRESEAVAKWVAAQNDLRLSQRPCASRRDCGAAGAIASRCKTP